LGRAEVGGEEPFAWLVWCEKARPMPRRRWEGLLLRAPVFFSVSFEWRWGLMCGTGLQRECKYVVVQMGACGAGLGPSYDFSGSL
jgi:hypothetical protein